MDTRPRTSLISFCTVQLRTLCAAHSLATLCLFMTSGPDPGELPGFWGSMVSRHAPIPRKGSGKQQQQQHLLKTHLFELYPNVYIALRILLTCPVTVASAERSLSKLKLIKTFNRTSMTDSRLSSLAMLSIENDCARSLDYDNVITAFANKKVRSRLFK